MKYRIEHFDIDGTPQGDTEIEGRDIAGVLVFQLTEPVTAQKTEEMASVLARAFEGRQIVVLNHTIRFVRLVPEVDL